MANTEKASAIRLMNFKNSGSGSGIDLKYHRFEWYINPDTLYIRGAVTSRFLTTSSLQDVSFDLSNALTVDSVLYNGQQIQFNHSPDDILNISFPVPLAPGSLESVTVHYQGVPDSAGFGAFVKSRHADGPIIWTLSEPYGSKEWWPCKQNLEDKIDSIDIIVTTPSGNRVAANGVLVDELSKNGTTTYHWRHRYPIAYYLIGIAVTNYAAYSDYVMSDGDSLEVLNYVFPSSLDEAKSQTPNLIPIFELFEQLFGPYPFKDEKYGHAQFDWGGGMEHQTMSFMTNFGHELMAHELAHQWFGNKITCANWGEIWLNEGFATYLTGLTYETMFDGQWWDRWKRLNIERVVSEPGGSVYVYDTSSVNRIFNSRLSYSKGALVLHMLRWIIGDDAFFEALQNYLSDPLLAYGTATTDNLKGHMEAASGLNLFSFFNNWIYKEGYPIYDVLWSQKNNGELRISLSQETSHPSVSFLQLPVPLRLKNDERDTLVVLNNYQPQQEFRLNIDFPVDSVLFDPDRWLIAKAKIRPDEYYTPGEINMRLNPNPVADWLHLNLTSNKFALEKVEIYDKLGKRVALFDHLSNPGYHYSFDISHLNNGVYIVKAHVDYWFIATRFVKAH